MDRHGAHHQGHHGVGRNAQRQQGDEGGLRARIVGRLRRCNTADIALAKRDFAGLGAQFLFQCIGSKCRQQSAATGQNAQRRTQESTAQHSRRHLLDVVLGGEQTRHLGREDFAVVFRLGQIRDDLAVAEHAHGNHHKANAVGELRNVKAETRHAGVDVGADQTQQQTQHDHGNRLEQRTRSQHHSADQAQHHQGKVFGRAEFKSQLSQRGRKGRQNQRAHATGEERTHTGRSQGRPGSPFSGHLVAVNTGDHRRRFTRQVHQDCSGRATVLGAVVNTCQHDECRHRWQSVSGRQQHGDGGHRADARQHTNERAQHDTDEGVEQVDGRERHTKTQ